MDTTFGVTAALDPTTYSKEIGGSVSPLLLVPYNLMFHQLSPNKELPARQEHATMCQTAETITAQLSYNVLVSRQLIFYCTANRSPRRHFDSI